jgi:hypothetical protein
MADTGRYDDFIPGEHVERLSDGRRGTVHHSLQFPGEPWKFAVDFEDGSQATLTSLELSSVDELHG